MIKPEVKDSGKALKFDFILINDECYSEIYFNKEDKPASLLEASILVGNTDFKNVLVMNSICAISGSGPSIFTLSKGIDVAKKTEEHIKRVYAI